MGRLFGPALTLALVVTLACSSPDRAPLRPAPRAPAVVNLSPGAFRDQATIPDQAVILATDARGRATVLPLPARPGKVRVDAIDAHDNQGRMTRIWFAPAPRPRPGFGRHEPKTDSHADSNAVGAPTWRAAIWTARLAVASLLNKDMTNIRVRVDAKPRQSGPPDSALLAAGLLASLTGRDVDPKVTLWGMVNPDGTLGPVRDMATRMDRAVRAGKRVVGYPAGMTHGQADMTVVARDLGIEARALGNVRDAYALLTGHSLAAPVAVAQRDMEVNPAEVVHLEAGYQAWRRLVSQRWASIVELTGAGKLPRSLDRLARAARSEATAAEVLWQQKRIPLAHDRMVHAAVLTAATAAIWQVVERVQDGDMAGARQRLDEPAPAHEAGAPDQDENAGQDTSLTPGDKAMSAVTRFEPATLADHMLLIAAAQSALRSQALAAAVTPELERARAYLDALAPDAAVAGDQADKNQAQPAPADQPARPAGKAADIEAQKTAALIARIAPLMLLRSRARVEAEVAMQMLRAPRPRGPAYTLDQAGARRLAREYAAVARANLDAFRSLYIPHLTDELRNIPEGRAKHVLMLREPHYLAAHHALGRSRSQTDRDPSGSSRSAAAILVAKSQLAWFEAAVLMSTWYSLGVRADEATGLAESLVPDASLDSILARAEQAARQHAAAARAATGKIPREARVSYQLARLLSGEHGFDHGQQQADSDATLQRLRALELYWTSSALSQLAVALART